MPDKGKHPERICRLEHMFHRHDVKLAYVFGSMAEPVRAFLVGGPLNVSDPLADIDIGGTYIDVHVSIRRSSSFQKEHANPVFKYSIDESHVSDV